MLNVLGAFVLGAITTTVLVVLIGLAVIRPAAKFVAFAIAGASVALLVTIGAVGGFAPAVTGPFPAPVFAFLILMIAGLTAWFVWPAFRRAVTSIPLEALVGMHGVRVAGIFFLLLHTEGRLAAPFSTSAGWGDIIAGAIAIPLAAQMIWRGAAPRWLLSSWNALGILDLITAIALGALSAPGTPFRVFTEAPGTLAMGTLPWVMIPAFLVPLFLMSHFAIAVRLRASDAADVRTHERINDVSPEAAIRRIA
jgi:hypothetical protein